MGLYQPVVPDNYEGGTERSHLFRYHFAKGFVDPTDIVIDAGCGVGYGTELISRCAKKVIGIERDEEAIRHAMSRHKKDNNYFICTNLDQMESFPIADVVIAIEIIEHLRYPKSFIGKIQQSTKRKIIFSVPVIPTMKDDPTHLHDFTEQQIYDMVVNDRWQMIGSARMGICLLVAMYRKNA